MDPGAAPSRDYLFLKVVAGVVVGGLILLGIARYSGIMIVAGSSSSSTPAGKPAASPASPMAQPASPASAASTAAVSPKANAKAEAKTVPASVISKVALTKSMVPEAPVSTMAPTSLQPPKQATSE